ncbi:MAG: T9SS type A sorting domain-containing protein, partial [Saprospiraceae bacterium]|nr:T9SS type A sorting domain-containing protein [Saprospiraceae bacterium]
EGAFAVSPNPAAPGEAIVTMTLPAGYSYRVTLTDLIGRVVINQPVSADRQSYPLTDELNTGTYFVHLWQQERPVAVEKLVITR